MRRIAFFSTGAVAAALILSAFAVAPADAKPGWKGGGGGPPGFGRGVKSGWQNMGQPPGWSRGNKRGWYNGGSTRGRVPPGWR